MVGSTRTSWKVRATWARRAILKAAAGSSVLEADAARIGQRTGDQVEHRGLAEPLGPIRPTTSPGSTVNDRSPTATSPPKLLRSRSTVSGVPACTRVLGGGGMRVATRLVAARPMLLHKADDALRQEIDDHHEHNAEQDAAEFGKLAESTSNRNTSGTTPRTPTAGAAQ